LSLIAGVLGKSNTGGDEVVKWGPVVLLTFLVTVHILNWYGDWIRFSEMVGSIRNSVYGA